MALSQKRGSNRRMYSHDVLTTKPEGASRDRRRSFPNSATTTTTTKNLYLGARVASGNEIERLTLKRPPIPPLIDVSTDGTPKPPTKLSAVNISIVVMLG